MTDSYIVARYGQEWFVVHARTETVTARCDNEYAARGIATKGNESRAERAEREQTAKSESALTDTTPSQDSRTDHPDVVTEPLALFRLTAAQPDDPIVAEGPTT